MGDAIGPGRNGMTDSDSQGDKPQKKPGVGRNGQPPPRCAKRSRGPTYLGTPSTRAFSMYRMYYIEGHSLDDVSIQFEDTKPNVSRVCAKVHRWIGDRVVEEAREVRVGQTLRFEHLYSEAMNEWRRSKEPFMSRSTIVKPNGDTLVRQRMSERAGDPRLLQVAIAALAEIRKVWALDVKPENGSDGASEGVVDDRTISVMFNDSSGTAERDESRLSALLDAIGIRVEQGGSLPGFTSEGDDAMVPARPNPAAE